MGKNKKLFIAFYAVLLSSLGNAQQVWTLKSCIDTAFKKNISLNQEQLGSQINKINLTQSKAGLLPNLNVNDAHSLNYGNSYDPYTYQYSNKAFTNNSLSLNSSVTLFNGFFLLNTVRQNKLLYEAGMLDVEKTKNDIMLNVLAGYMQVLMDYEAIAVAQAQVEATKTEVGETQKFVDFGKVAELSLLQIQSQLASDKLVKINAENQLQLDKLTLLQLMETPVRSDFDIERQELGVLFPEIPLSTEEIDKISLSFLPQIKSASMKTDASLFSLKMAKSGWLPKLLLGGALKTGYSSLNSELLSDQFKNNYSQVITFTLSVPIFDNFIVKSSVAIAKINVMNAQLNEQQTKNDLRKNIETVYTNQVLAGKKLSAIEEQMDLETRTYTDMKKKYTVGAIDATDFLIEKNNYNKAAMSLIQAKYDYVLKVKMVDFYLGKTLTFN